MLVYIYEVKTAEHIDSEVLFPNVYDQMTKKFKLHVNFFQFSGLLFHHISVSKNLKRNDKPHEDQTDNTVQ